MSDGHRREQPPGAGGGGCQSRDVGYGWGGGWECRYGFETSAVWASHMGSKVAQKINRLKSMYGKTNTIL